MYKLQVKTPERCSWCDLMKKLEELGLYYDQSTVSLLYTALRQNGKTRAIMLRGPPGVGKTALTEALAMILNAEYIFFQCTLGTSEDDLIYKLLPSERTVSGIEKVLGPLPEALVKSREKLTILVLDEFDKTRPSADALLLDFLQNCRVSVRISNEEKVIRGNPENLIVFLTSNDEREFSEPLLRRVIVINIPPLPTLTVYNIMLKYFDEGTAALLSQIYDDTIKAGLRKPATVQELLQLGRAIKELGGDADLKALLRSYVVKYDDDWMKYLEYIKNRKPYQWAPEKERKDEKVSQYYEYEQQHVEVPTQPAQQPRKDMPKKLPRIVVRWPSIESADKESKSEDTVEEYGVTPSDARHYDAVIKITRPEPTDNPAFLQSATFYRDYAKVRPLTYDDIKRIEEKKLYNSFEKLLENSQLFIVIDDVDMIDHRDVADVAIERSLQVVYYTKSLVRMKNDLVDVAVIYKEDGKVKIEIVTNTNDPYAVIRVIDCLLRAQVAYKELVEHAAMVTDAIERIKGKYNRWTLRSCAEAKECFEDLNNVVLKKLEKARDLKMLTPITIKIRDKRDAEFLASLLRSMGVRARENEKEYDYMVVIG